MSKYTLTDEKDSFRVEALDRRYLGDITELFKVSYEGWITGVGGAEFLQVYDSTKSKGDIPVFDGHGNWIRFPVGSDGQFLKADSTQPLGVRWASGGGGGGGTTLADSYLLGTTAADSKLSLLNSLGGLFIQDNSTPITGPLLKVQAFGGGNKLQVTKDDITAGVPVFGATLGSGAAPFTNLYLTTLNGPTGSSVQVASNLVGTSDGGIDLGLAGTRFGTVYTNTVSAAAGVLTVQGTPSVIIGNPTNPNTVTVDDTTLAVEGKVVPATTKTYDIGSTSLGWSNLYTSSVLGNSAVDLALTANTTQSLNLGNGTLPTALVVNNTAITFGTLLTPDNDLGRTLGASNKRIAQVWTPQISGGSAQTLRVTAGAAQAINLGDANTSDMVVIAATGLTTSLVFSPQSDNTLNLGKTGARWATIFGTSVQSSTGDLGITAGSAANVNIGPSNATTALVVGATTTTSSNNILPAVTATSNLGATGTVWANIFGNLVQSAAGTNLALKAGTTSSVVIGNGSAANVLSINHTAITQSVGLLPNADNTLDIGSGGARFANVYGTTINSSTVNSTAFVGSSNPYVELSDGTAVGVSAAGKIRLIYNNTTKKLQYSADTAAYADVGGGAGGGTFATTYSSTPANNVITESSAGGPLTIKDAASTIGSLFKVQNNGATINFIDAASSGTTITNSVVASATPTPVLTLTGQAHTAATAGTEFFDVNLNLARTVQFGTGTLALQRAFVVQAPTYGFVGASTTTLAATMAITGPPIAGTNATLGTDILTAVSTNLLLDRAGLAANSLPALHLRNATASSGGTTIQKSPGILFEGSAWTGAASQPTKCLWVQEPTNGATIVTGMSLYTSVNNAAAALHHKMGISTNATWPKEMQTGAQFRFRTTVADGATALPWAFDTSASYATAGATLFRINNNANEVFEVGTSGAGGPQQYMRIKGGNGERLAPAFAGNTASSAHCGYEIGNAFDYWLITCESTTASVGRGNGQINFMMTVPGGNFDVGGNTTADPGVLWRWTKAVAANTVSKQVQLYNNTAATAGNQRYSPFLSFLGNGWKTNATAGSQTVEFSLGTVPIQGAAAPTGQFQFYSSINGAGPTQIGEITDTGSLRFNRLGGRGSAPTPTAGTGAGAGATVTLLSGSTDVSGVIQVVTAGTPSASQAIVTVAFSSAFEFAPHVELTPANDAAGDLTGTSAPRVIYANTTTAQFVVSAGSAALTTGVTYRWHYFVSQATA